MATSPAAAQAHRPPAKKPPVVPAGTPAERVMVLISIMDRLHEVLERELDLARSDALTGVIALQADKLALTGRLDEIGRVVRLDRAGLAGLAPELMNRLKESGMRLNRTTAASADFFSIQAAASKAVIDVLVRSVNRDHRVEAAYSRQCTGYMPRGPRPSTTGAMTFTATL
ncbi:MAG: hypothetical protein WCF85_06275 [Rhodospirillaceae bacterium]